MRTLPAILIVAVVGLGLGVVWLPSSDSSEQIRQVKVLRSAAVIVAGALAVGVWGTFFSRLPARKRFKIATGLAAVAAAFAVLFEYRGVTGDLVPQFGTRFRMPATDLVDVELSSLPGVRNYPQFLGPGRNGRLEGVGLARNWSADPPRVLWRRPVGRGWSGFAVFANSAVTHEQHGVEERVVSYELSTGRVRWASREAAHYENVLAGEGPRATPSIAAGRVFALGGSGLLTALDLDTGELLWKRDLMREHGAEVPTWGKSNAPLVWKHLVIVSAGGSRNQSLVAYNVDNGELVWHGGHDPSGYSSPMTVTIAGTEQIVSFNHDSISAHDPTSGDILWRQSWSPRQPNVSQPLAIPDDRLLVSSSYGVGSKLFRLQRSSEGVLEATVVWESTRLKSKFGNLIYHDGYVYGLDDGILVCIDPNDGRRRWKRGRYGHGQLLLVDDLLLVQGEHGDIALVEPSPDGHRELARYRVMEAKVWNPPALAGPYLLMRNDAEAVLVELPVVVPSVQ